MEELICEAGATGEYTCDYCDRTVSIYDRLTDETKSCLSCTYSNDFKRTQDCLQHKRDFDIHDLELRVELTRICQHDIEKSDTAVSETTMVLPEDMFKPLEKLCKLHNSTPNAEIVAALTWYTSAVLDVTKVAEDKDMTLDSIPVELPEELKLGLGDINES